MTTRSLWHSEILDCSNGIKDVVKLLVNVGLYVNDTTHYGDTPLLMACGHGHYDTVKYLLDLNDDQTYTSCVDLTILDKDGLSFFTACSYGHQEVVKLLIDVGMNVNDTTKKGYTSLYIACLNSHNETIKFLIDLNCQT